MRSPIIVLIMLLLPALALAVLHIDTPEFSTIGYDHINVSYNISGSGEAETTLYYKRSGEGEYTSHAPMTGTLPYVYNTSIYGLEENTFYDFYIMVDNNETRKYSTLSIVRTLKEPKNVFSLINNNIGMTAIVFLIVGVLLYFAGLELLAGLVLMVFSFVLFANTVWVYGFVTILVSLYIIFKK